jgi:hypothetical protein
MSRPRTTKTGRAVLAFLLAVPAGLFVGAGAAIGIGGGAPLVYGPPALLVLGIVAAAMRRGTPWIAAALLGLAIGGWMAWGALPPGVTS